MSEHLPQVCRTDSSSSIFVRVVRVVRLVRLVRLALLALLVPARAHQSRNAVT